MFSFAYVRARPCTSVQYQNRFCLNLYLIISFSLLKAMRTFNLSHKQSKAKIAHEWVNENVFIRYYLDGVVWLFSLSSFHLLHWMRLLLLAAMPFFGLVFIIPYSVHCSLSFIFSFQFNNFNLFRSSSTSTVAMMMMTTFTTFVVLRCDLSYTFPKWYNGHMHAMHMYLFAIVDVHLTECRLDVKMQNETLNEWWSTIHIGC